MAYSWERWPAALPRQARYRFVAEGQSNSEHSICFTSRIRPIKILETSMYGRIGFSYDRPRISANDCYPADKLAFMQLALMTEIAAKPT